MQRGGLLLATALAVGSLAANAADLSLKDRADARKIYVAKCAKCHRFYDPASYGDADWQRWADSMNRKSKLKPPQAELLNRYLQAYRAGQLPGKPEAK
jgi:cytochrome c553